MDYKISKEQIEQAIASLGYDAPEARLDEVVVMLQGLLDQQQETYLTAEEAAQRLRELSKPDCVYTLCADDSPTPQTLESACGGAVWYLGDDGKGAYPKFCHHCGGAVREVT